MGESPGSDIPIKEKLNRQLCKRAVIALLQLLVVYILIHFHLLGEVLEDLSLLILVIGLILIFVRTFSLISGYYRVRKFIDPQSSDSVTKIIEQCKPLHRSFEPKKKHVVLLIHGFISSPIIFDELIKEFEEHQVDYQAPLIYGFGIKRIKLLFSLTEDDWIRQVTEVYDLLDSQYESISVIGHSLGGALALYLSQMRPVNHLILVAPAIFPCTTQKLHNFLATNKILYRVLPWVIPLLPIRSSGTKLNEESIKKYSLYPVAPTRGAFNVLRLQKLIKVTKAQYQTLDLFFGTQDLAVDGQKVWDHLKRSKILHRIHKLDYTGHNPLIEGENDLVGWIVMYILTNQLSWPPENQEVWEKNDN